MLIVVDKPTWITIYDVIRKLKHLYPKMKIWHSGTLDPMATGLMLIGVGPDTKKLTELTWLDKSYTATIDFSKDSDTRDLQYRDWIKNEKLTIKNWKVVWIIKNNKEIEAPTLQQIEEKLDLLVPEYSLPLTPFSAKKKDGKKLYELAREWNLIQENRNMKTNSYKIIEYKFPELKLQLDVWSGTYIRSIAHWLWSQFGLWGILTSLRRISVWKYELENMNLSSTAQRISETQFFGMRELCWPSAET